MIRAVFFDMYETLCSHYRCPLYFGAQIAGDWGVDAQAFFRLWRDDALEHARTTGRLTLEELLLRIAADVGIHDPAQQQRLIRLAAEKRRAVKRQCLHCLHPEILPMLWGLKARGIKLGLISNCYIEEAEVIRRWAEVGCFDDLRLSCEQGIAKPDPAIFRRGMAALGVEPGECLYLGDGGSMELEAASGLGMRAIQAAWYLREVNPAAIRQEYEPLESPMQVLAKAERR